MRMPVDELFADARTDVPERERPLFFLHTRVQSHLEQHIAQLLAQKAGIGKVDGVRQLLEQVVGVVLEELRHDLLDFVHGVQALFCLEVSLHRELLVQVVFCFGEVCVDGLD